MPLGRDNGLRQKATVEKVQNYSNSKEVYCAVIRTQHAVQSETNLVCGRRGIPDFFCPAWFLIRLAPRMVYSPKRSHDDS